MSETPNLDALLCKHAKWCDSLKWPDDSVPCNCAYGAARKELSEYKDSAGYFESLLNTIALELGGDEREKIIPRISALKRRAADLERENAILRRRNRVLDVVQADLAVQHYGGDPQTLANTAEAFATETRAALNRAEGG